MNCRNPREALIISVQSPRYCREPRHRLLDRWISLVGSAKQALDLAALPYDEAFVASRDQWRSPEDESVSGASEP